MNNYITEVIGIILFCLAMYLLINRATWFHRSAIVKSIRPKDGESIYDSLSVFKHYCRPSIECAPFYYPDKNFDQLTFHPLSHSELKEQFHLDFVHGFLRKKSRRNFLQTFKLIGYINRKIRPNVVVKYLKPSVRVTSKLLRGRLFIVFLIFSLLVSFSTFGDLTFFFEFMGFFVMMGLFFYTLYLIIEFFSYILQNIYSLRFAKSFKVSQDEYRSLFIYLWLSFLLFCITQVFKWILICIMMFVIIGLFN